MKILIVSFWMALWVNVALADLTLVQNLETSAIPEESGKGSTMTMKMKGQKARIDFSGMPISSIVDLKSKQLFFLDHKQKQVMVMPLEFMQSMMALSALGAATVPEKPAIQKPAKFRRLTDTPAKNIPDHRAAA